MNIHEKIKQSPYILYQDDDLLVVLDIDPITKGHVLILPQKRYLDMDDMPMILLRKLFKAAQCYIKVLKQKYHPKGYSMMQNGGKFNDIGVFHLHVFPRFDAQEFGFQTSEVTDSFDSQVLKNLLKMEIDQLNKH